MSYQDKPSLDELYHYGTPKRSGRYPYGSGENPNQHSGDFLSRVNELKKSGMSEPEIAKALGIVNKKGEPSTTNLRTQIALAKDEQRSGNVARAKHLREKGYSTTEIGKQMGVNESTVRSWFNENSEARMNQARTTADYLKKVIDEKGMIDVGAGTELELGVSREKLNQALYILEMEGYPTHGGRMDQVTNPGKKTTLKVVCPPGTEAKEIYNPENIHSVKDYDQVLTDDGTKIRPAFEYPASMDSSRLKIRYAEDGGIQKDGIIEIRRGVEDLSLGDSHYAQVRILVDNDRYLKGMAVYSDNMPDGVDVVFNTNKTSDKPMRDVLKKISNDPDNPFGSLIKEHGGQSHYIDENGNEKLSLINKRAEEGDWGEWTDTLASQFLSKQPVSLAKKQLNLAVTDRQAEFDEICSLTNPTVKKALLQDFADGCDSTAVHLEAAALPRQKYQVLIPIPSMKDNEVYAPNYRDGETVALVRYPHGGTFEIPVLTVNNGHRGAAKVLGKTPADAIGINSKVAERLSGADFDGDTVMVIPTNSKVKITSTPPLEGLKGFDPKMEYPERKGMKYMKNTQTEMGKISNLITDMTIKGANQDELARAVRHSMVVIDAEKHKLDYKQSEIDNGISSLKKRYQGTLGEDGKYRYGAATLISRAKNEVSVTKRKGSPKIDPETGKQIWKEDDDPYYTVTKTNKKGEVKTVTKKKTQPSTQMAEVDDAYNLVSDLNTPMERAYADYANKMKSLANQARKSILTAGSIKYSSSAATTYSKEVDHLLAQLNVAKKNAPRERQAQTIANATVEAKKQANPGMTKKEIKKAGQQALTAARQRVGAKRTPIEINDREWEAIQAGAISESRLSEILKYTDTDKLRERATPRSKTTMSQAKIAKLKNMSSSGDYTTAQMAAALGVSSSTVSKYLSGKE